MNRIFWLLVCLGVLPGLAFGGEYLIAKPGYQYQFPRDHRPHRGYKTEWWYYSGQLTGPEQERYGFQFTIFRLERPQGVLYLFHCGLSQKSGFIYDEVLARDFPGIGGLQGDSLWVHRNRLLIQGNRHRLISHCHGADLNLDLTHRLPPVIQGQDGISPKGDEPGNATHYYSVVDLEGSGQLKLKGKTRAVKAKVWMDHEFGSNFMGPNQKGWDWMTLRLDSKVRLMVFRMRQTPGPDFYWATVISPDGQAKTVRDLHLTPTGSFVSKKSKARYPKGFRLTLPGGELVITPWSLDQELQTQAAGMTYFEGAVDVVGTWAGKPTQGQGYLEMTGYLPIKPGMF